MDGLEYYLNLPWRVEVRTRTEADGQVVYWAANPEIEHCEAYGDTPVEALAKLRAQRAECLSFLLRHRAVIAPPTGRF